MRTFLFALALMAVAATASAASPPQSGEVVFKSQTFGMFRDFLSGKPGEPIDIKAWLKFPETVQDKYPAVVILHTIGGYRDSNEGWHAESYRKAGFATLVYDSIAARFIQDAPTRGGGTLWAPVVADAFNALKVLAAHPRIDKRRIAVTGYSLGGEATRVLAFDRLRKAFIADDLRFAAHVAVYPCHIWGVQPGPDVHTGAPVLEQLGEKDDCGPTAKAAAYYEYHKAKGHPAPVRTTIYPGAHHSWTDPHFATARHFPNHASPSKCPILMIGPAGNTLFEGGAERPFDRDTWTACFRASKGYTQGFDAAAREKSFAEAVAFIRAAMGL